MRYTSPYMNFIMTPPQQEQAKYDMYVPQVSTMRIVSDARTTGLGDVPLMNVGGGGDQNSWVMPVVIIVVSAMALMTLYVVLSKR
jgi:hypothetical protein